MAYSNNVKYTGKKLFGSHGIYIVGKKLGSGGNGEVYTVEMESSDDSLVDSNSYVVKILAANSNDNKELKKREDRFKKEINTVIGFQDRVTGIIPIYDASIMSESEAELLWYVMPFAEAYISRNYTIDRRLEQMLKLGRCLQQIHNLGFAHRDIKPKNLLVWKNDIYLSDFGLVWNINSEDDHITEVNDRLGPQAIRPPELQPVEKVDGVDYRQSDIYLFAKTIWMVLNCNNNGFPGEYSRKNNLVYIERGKLNIKTAEPLHQMLEGATKDNYWERITLLQCLALLKDQLKIVREEAPENVLNKWIYEENTNRISETLQSDEKVYTKNTHILKILTSMINTAGLIFVEPGKETPICKLRKANLLKDNVFEIEIVNPYQAGQKKTIKLWLNSIHLKKDLTYEIDSNEFLIDTSNIQVFKSVFLALSTPEKKVCLNSKYLIKMERI